MKTNTDLFEKVPVPKAVATMAVPTMISMHLQHGRYLFHWSDTGSTAGCGCIFGNTGIYDLYGAGKSVWHRWKLGYIQGIR